MLRDQDRSTSTCQANEENELNEKSLTIEGITPDLRQRLLEHGERNENIDAMSPSEARALLEYFDSF